MKRILLLLVLVFFSYNIVIAQTRYWVGEHNGDWGDADNWSLSSGGVGGASVPNANSFHVVFDRSFTGTVNMNILSTNLHLQSIHVTENAEVTLLSFHNGVGGTTKTITLHSNIESVKGLQVDALSLLALSASHSGGGTFNYNLSLTGSNGVTGDIAGMLQFTGIGDTPSPKLIGAASGNTANIIVRSGGVIQYLPGSGNTMPTNGMFLNMESGAVYEILKNGGSFPQGNWHPQSIARVINSGANVPLFNGSMYGNLEWNCSGQTFPMQINRSVSFNNVTLINTNSTHGNGDFRIKGNLSPSTDTVTVLGDLTISNTSRITLSGGTVTSGNGGVLMVKGNLINNGEIRTNSADVSTTNKIIFNGNGSQTYSGAGLLRGSNVQFVIDNNDPLGNLILTVPLTIEDSLVFAKGKILSSKLAPVIIAADTTQVIGASSSTGFVHGPVKKIGSGDFDFPIGKYGVFAPIKISGGANSSNTDAFTAEYMMGNPQAAYGNDYAEPDMDHVSYKEYWTLSRDNGIASKIVTLNVHEDSHCYDIEGTYIALYNSINQHWERVEGTSTLLGTNPPLETGTLVSNSPLHSQFDDFDILILTLGTNLDEEFNPLPLGLLRFNANRQGSDAIVINWEVASIISENVVYELQRSIDKIHFTTIYTKRQDGFTNHSYTDYHLPKGITYYRLKIKYQNGRVGYSPMATVFDKENVFSVISLLPNPVRNNAAIYISATTPTNSLFTVWDVTGKMLMQWQQVLSAGNQIVNGRFDNLTPGIYLLKVSAGNYQQVIRFVKY